jgi:hypothetical protein
MAQCTAKSKSTGKRCGSQARVGLNVCRVHGGNVPAARAKSERAKATKRVKFQVGQMARLLEDAELDEGDPAQGMLEGVRRAGALMRVYGGLVGELSVKLEYEERTLPDGTEIGYPSSLLGLDRYSQAEVHVLVREYRSSIELYAKACKLALDAGIAAAAVRVQAEKAQMLAQAMQSIFSGLDLTPAQRARVPSLVRTHLLSLPTDDDSLHLSSAGTGDADD